MPDYTSTYRTLLSLFDYTGTWSQPFEDTGWNVIRWDIQLDEFMDINLLEDAEMVLDMFEHVDGILAAAPCTDFASSGARWFKAKDEAGKTEESMEIVRQVMRLVDLFEPTDPDYEGTWFWVIENPVGRLNTLFPDLPKPRYFQPYEYAGYLDIPDVKLRKLDKIREKDGKNVTAAEADLILETNTYTKKTGLWGDFIMPEKKPIPPVPGSAQGSVMQRFGGCTIETKNARSMTPKGFAKAFFQANKNKVWDPDADIEIIDSEFSAEEIEENQMLTEKNEIMKYEIKELIDKGLDVNALPKDYQADVETIQMLSNDYTTPDDEDKDLVEDLDQKLVAKLKSEGLVKKATAAKTEYQWPHDMAPVEIKESIAQIDDHTEKSIKIVEGLDKDGETYFYESIVEASFPDETTVAEQKKDVKYLISEYKKSKEKKPAEKKPAEKKTEKKDDKKPAPKSIDKAIDDLVGKTIYFKPEKDKKWVSGKISNGYPAHKGSKDKWRLEFYPAGGQKWDFPAVSDIFTTEQMQKFLDGEVVKDYTLTKPKGVIISDFEKAQREIDDCLEEAKVERARKQAEDPEPKKKTTSQVFKEKSQKYVAALEKVSKVEKPDKAEQIKKIIEKAQEEIRKILFG